MTMNNVVDIKKVLEDKELRKQHRKLHAAASITVINKCLQYLQMNALKETEMLKAMMKRSLKELAKIKDE